MPMKNMKRRLFISPGTEMSPARRFSISGTTESSPALKRENGCRNRVLSCSVATCVTQEEPGTRRNAKRGSSKRTLNPGKNQRNIAEMFSSSLKKNSTQDQAKDSPIDSGKATVKTDGSEL